MWRSLALFSLALIWSSADARPIFSRGPSSNIRVTHKRQKLPPVGNESYVENRDNEQSEDSGELVAAVFDLIACKSAGHTTAFIWPDKEALPAPPHLYSIFLRGPPTAI